MVHERTSSAAGVRPAAPQSAATPPPEPALERPAEDAPAAEAEVQAEPPARSGPIPVEEVPLDPREIARASLAAGRNASLWWVSSGIGVAVLVALVVGTRTGSVVLAAVVAVCGVVRLVAPAPGPVALSVRARWIDVTVLFTLAVGLAFFAAVLPYGWV